MKLHLTFACLLMSSSVYAGWESLAPLPEPNGGFACGVVGGRLIVAGGTNWKDDTKHWLDVIWSYDPAANAWSVVGHLPQPCAYAASGVINDTLVIASGSDGKTASKQVLGLDATGKCRKLGELPAGAIYTASTVLNDELWMAGGASDPADLSTLKAAVTRLSVADGKLVVKPEPDAGKTGFGIGSAATAWKRAFVFGGARFDPAAQVMNLDEVLVLNDADPKTRLPHAIRGLSAVPVSDHHIYLAGGYPDDATGFTDQAWVFLATSGKVLPALPLPIKGMVHFASDDEWIYCLGGEDKKKHRSELMWRIRRDELMAAVIRP